MLIADRYHLRDRIGQGAMGEVWRAYDQTLDRPVAVKLLLPQNSDPTAAARFRLEAQTAGRLNHPNVVGILNFGAHEDRLFLVMELVDGDSLARAAPLPAERVARLAAQAAAGLAAAHGQGIVHRDIKPANLLLDTEGTLKIGDFGIARFLDDPGAALTATGQIVGTSLYLAPERALGKPAGPASDMYSLGCVLYQLLTGQTLFQADTALAVLHQHLDAAPVPPREIGVVLPPAFENYLLRLLAKRPEDRPTAQRAADWFAGGEWQRYPQPLPAQAPLAPAPGPATTYALPTAVPPVAQGTRRQPGVRVPSTHRRNLAAAVASVVAFLAAMLLGMTWFASDKGSAEAPPTTPTAPAASPTAILSSPSPQPSTAPGTSSAPAPVPSSEQSQTEPAAPEKGKGKQEAAQTRPKPGEKPKPDGRRDREDEDEDD